MKTIGTDENIWIQRYLSNYPWMKIVTDSSTNIVPRRTKSIEKNNNSSSSSNNHNSQSIEFCQNMKSIISSKTSETDFSDIERNNIYAETPPKMKSATLKNDTDHYMSMRQQRRPPVPVRSDSIRSIGSTTISSFSSQSTIPSNSYHPDSTVIMSRSVDASSSCELIKPIKNDTNHNKSKSTYDLEASISNNNTKCANVVSNGSFVPLESVKEDECLETNGNHNEIYSKNDNEQARILSDLLKKRYTSSTASTSMMPKNHLLHQRSSSIDPTDDELSTGYMNGFTRNHRIRSSLPFIIKPAVNTSKSNSLGLCFLICGNETKKVLLPTYISCMDTLKALFVRAFPQNLTMKQMEDDNIRIYIRESEKDIFYQLEDINDVKDRSILKIVQLNNNNINGNSKAHVSFKEPTGNGLTKPTIKNDITYQRLNRFDFASSTNGSIENKSNGNSSSSLHDLKIETISNGHTQPSTVLKGILSSPRSASTTPRIDDQDARNKMILMEQQLKSLTELVTELTSSTKPKSPPDFYNKSLHHQLHELKAKTHSLRNELFSIRRMQQSLHDNLKSELEHANNTIQEQLMRLNQNKEMRHIEKEFNDYVNNRTEIDKDLEDLELTVEELQNDLKFKQCYVTINDVESFALVLSTISRSLVDLKTSFPTLREKLSSFDQSSAIKFLHEEPERLDYTIKKCKRLTTMLYQIKQLAVNQESKSPRKITVNINEQVANRTHLLNEIQSITLNSEGRLKAIEKAEKLRKRRLQYESELEKLKQIKSTSDQINGYFDGRSLTSSLSTRTSICSTDSTNYPSPSSSCILRQALISSTVVNDAKTRLQSSLKPQTKVTFSQQLTTNVKPISISKKPKPNPPPRIQSAPASSIVSNTSTSSSSSSTTNGISRFCGMIPLLSADHRHSGRCYSFSSSSTDTDSIISSSNKSSKTINMKCHETTLMRASVTDL